MASSRAGARGEVRAATSRISHADLLEQTMLLQTLHYRLELQTKCEGFLWSNILKLWAVISKLRSVFAKIENLPPKADTMSV